MVRTVIKQAAFAVVAMVAGQADARDVVIDNASYRSFNPCSATGTPCAAFFSTMTEANSINATQTITNAYNLSFNLDYGLGDTNRVYVYDNGLFAINSPLTSLPSNPVSLAQFGSNVFSPLYDPSQSTPVSKNFQFSYGKLDNLNNSLTGQQYLRIRYDVDYYSATEGKTITTKVEASLIQDGNDGDFILWYGYGGYDGVTPTLPGSGLIGYNLGANSVDTTVSANKAAIEAKSDYGLFNYRFVNGAAGPVVPEPATWAMMIVGFGAVGASLRRVRPQAALARA